MWFILIAVLIAILITVISEKVRNPSNKEPPTYDTSKGNYPFSTTLKNESTLSPEIEPDTTPTNYSELEAYSGAYKRRYLLTKNEWAQYKKLKAITDSMRLIICPKVRLLDLIEPVCRSNKLLWKIQAKHVDFVICDQDLYVKTIIELDDNSHDQPDRQERDRFVDFVLSNAGYTVIHTRYITENTLDILKPESYDIETPKQPERENI